MSAVIPALFRANAQDDQSIAQMVALLDVQDGLPSARRLHEWAIETAMVRPGDQVVDLGSGTGTMTRQLAALVASADSMNGAMGWVTGVEPNLQLRALAESRAESVGVANSSFVDGLAGALPFEDSSVDLVWCERVLQHLTIRRRPSMTSRGCCAQVVVRCCWTQTRGPESSPISNPTSPRHLAGRP